MSFQLVHPLPGAVITTYWMGYVGHTGIDLAKPQGTPIVAAASGTVVFAGWHGTAAQPGYGNMLRLRHDAAHETLYAHMQFAALVSNGQYVQAGQTIGYVGSTGNSTGPHLHFEVIVDGYAKDPLPYLNNTNPTPNPGDDDLTPEQGRRLDVIYDTLTGGQAGVKHQGEIHRAIHGIPQNTANEVFGRVLTRRGGTQTGTTTFGGIMEWLDAQFEGVVNTIKGK